jgi:hypothetical protein
MRNLTLINLALSIIALLLSGLNVYWNFFRKPKLQILYKDQQPFRKYLLSAAHPESPEWYVRIKVINTQKAIAKNCVGKIVEWHTDNKQVESFDPIKLHWVSNELDNYAGIDLSYQEFDYLDIIVTQRWESKFIIYTNTHLRGTPLQFDANSRHLFKVAIYSEKEAFSFSWFLIEKDLASEDDRLIAVTQIAENRVGKLLKRA